MLHRLGTYLIVFLLSAGILPAAGQGRLVDITRESVLTPRQMADSVVTEFGYGIDVSSLKASLGLVTYAGTPVSFASIRYRTTDPLGRETIASGLIAYPEKGGFRGVVEVPPFAREKHLCGSRRNYSMECLISSRGFVTLIPDTIGYGSTEDVPIALLMNDNTAQVTADMRLAAAEFFAGKGRRLPRRSLIFGYSLGASGAFAAACHYHAHPELEVKVDKLILGSGAYNPETAIRHTLEASDCGFLLYPSIALSLHHWKGFEMSREDYFTGDVLRDFERITLGAENFMALAQEYGHDPHGYLHPDFFTPEQNPGIRRLMEILSELSVPRSGDRLSRGTKVYLRHSAADNFVPVACSDSLYQFLRESGVRVRYRRDKEGDHYQEAARSLTDLFVITLL